MHLVIQGHHLPGRTFSPSDRDSDAYDNVHVAVQVRAEPVGLVPGDADAASWDVDVRVVTGDDGGLDFRGPAVHGKRGERFVYLTWGDVAGDGTFSMFRRAKLMLDRIEPDLVREVEKSGQRLVATVDLTDACGGPRCARLDPPALTVTVSP